MKIKEIIELFIENKLNPFIGIENIHNDGLDYLGSQIDTIPTVNEIVLIVEKYFYDKYFFGREHEDFPRELVGLDAIISINKSFDFEKELNKLDITPNAKSYIKKTIEIPFLRIEKYSDNTPIFDILPAIMGAKTTLKEEIFNSELTCDQKILPLVAIQTLETSIKYWKSVYENKENNMWFKYIIEKVGGLEISDIHWEEVIKDDISGAVFGAVQGFLNNEKSNGIIIGGGIGSIAASSKNLLQQLFKYLQESEGLIEGGQEVIATKGNMTKVFKSVVVITECDAGNAITLPIAKADLIYAGFGGTVYNPGCDTILDSSFSDQVTKYNKKKATARHGAGLLQPIRVSKGSMISYHQAHSGTHSIVTELSLSDCN